MVLDALRGYFQLASGVTEEPRQRAAAAARSLLAQGGDADTGVPGQLQQQVAALAEELVVTSRANRELLLGLIRTEVERALARLGIASADDVENLRRSVERLERLVREQQSSAGQPAGTAGSGKAATKKTATKKAATKNVTKKAAATKESAGTTAAIDAGDTSPGDDA